MTAPRDPNHPGTDTEQRSGHAGVPDIVLVNSRLARFMFDMQADSYDADDEMRELAWADVGIRGFWVGQAEAVTSFLRLQECA